jgi:hypothetical protein
VSESSAFLSVAFRRIWIVEGFRKAEADPAGRRFSNVTRESDDRLLHRQVAGREGYERLMVSRGQ